MKYLGETTQNEHNSDTQVPMASWLLTCVLKCSVFYSWMATRQVVLCVISCQPPCTCNTEPTPLTTAPSSGSTYCFVAMLCSSSLTILYWESFKRCLYAPLIYLVEFSCYSPSQTSALFSLFYISFKSTIDACILFSSQWWGLEIMPLLWDFGNHNCKCNCDFVLPPLDYKIFMGNFMCVANLGQKHPNSDKMIGRILEKQAKVGNCPASWNKKKIVALDPEGHCVMPSDRGNSSPVAEMPRNPRLCFGCTSTQRTLNCNIPKMSGISRLNWAQPTSPWSAL